MTPGAAAHATLPLPVDGPPGPGLPLTAGNGNAGGTLQLPVIPPDPNAGPLGLLFRTG